MKTLHPKSEIARICGVHIRTVKRWAAAGKVPPKYAHRLKEQPDWVTGIGLLPEPLQKALGPAIDRGYLDGGAESQLAIMATRYLAKRGHHPSYEPSIAPPGFSISRKSTLTRIDEDGHERVVMRWNITRSDGKPSWEEIERAILESRDSWVTPTVGPPRAPAAPEAQYLLGVLPLSDAHVGMLAWGRETGGSDWDLDIAREELGAAYARLVDSVSHCGTVLIAGLGDFLHFDGLYHKTTKGTQLDGDGRVAKVFAAALNLWKDAIYRALRTAETVLVCLVPGNHDELMTAMLVAALDAHYENEPRVRVQTRPRAILYAEWGKTLLGFTHGDKAKGARLAAAVPEDQPEAWARCPAKHVHMGHVHHDVVKDHGSVKLESHRVWCPADGYHASAGYRAAQSLKAIVYDSRTPWETERYTISVGRRECVKTEKP